MKNDKVKQLIHQVLKKLNIKVSKEIENLMVQVFKFVIVGGTAFIIDFITLFIFKEFAKLDVIVSNTLSFTISTIYNYIASVNWVFDVDKDKGKKKQFIIFVGFSIVGLLINNLLMYLLVKKLKLYYLLVKIIATIIVMIFNFITRKLFLEKKKK